MLDKVNRGIDKRGSEEISRSNLIVGRNKVKNERLGIGSNSDNKMEIITRQLITLLHQNMTFP